MDFTIFPFVMIALCVVMMVLMMRGMGHMHGGHQTRKRDR
jgi:preprotein translocase subunit SecG